MTSQTRLIIAVIFLLLVALVATWNFYGRRASLSEPAVIKIGVAAALSGDGAEWGQGEVKAAELAIAEQNQRGGVRGQKLELVIEDTQSSNLGTVNAVNKLINVNRVPAIIGPSWIDTYVGANELADQNQVVFLTPSAALEATESGKDFKYIFSTWFPEQPEINRLIRYLTKRKLQTVSIVASQYPYGITMAELFRAEAARSGISIVSSDVTAVGTKDFRTIFSKIARLKPDTLYLEPYSYAELGAMLKQLRELGLRAQLVSSSPLQNDEFLENFGPLLEGTIYTYPRQTTAIEQFKERYQIAYGELVKSPSATNAYDATKAIIETLRRGAKTGTEIQQELYRLKIPGVTFKEISFDRRGQTPAGEHSIKAIQSGKFVILEE